MTILQTVMDGTNNTISVCQSFGIIQTMDPLTMHFHVKLHAFCLLVSHLVDSKQMKANHSF